MSDRRRSRPKYRRRAAWPDVWMGPRHPGFPRPSRMKAADIELCVDRRTDSAWRAGLPHREIDRRSPDRPEQIGPVPTDRAAKYTLGHHAADLGRAPP